MSNKQYTPQISNTITLQINTNNSKNLSKISSEYGFIQAQNKNESLENKNRSTIKKLSNKSTFSKPLNQIDFLLDSKKILQQHQLYSQ